MLVFINVYTMDTGMYKTTDFCQLKMILKNNSNPFQIYKKIIKKNV